MALQIKLDGYVNPAEGKVYAEYWETSIDGADAKIDVRINDKCDRTLPVKAKLAHQRIGVCTLIGETGCNTHVKVDISSIDSTEASNSSNRYYIDYVVSDS